MKNYLIILLLPLAINANAQVFKASQLNTQIFSPAPISDIEAVSTKGVAMINLTKKEIEVEIPINSFTFKKALMQTNFNDKYLESDKFPFATFKGRYQSNIDLSKPGVYHLTVSGKFTIHGVEKTKIVKCVITVKETEMLFKSNFDLLSADYKIEPAEMLYRKAGETVNIDVNGSLILIKK